MIYSARSLNIRWRLVALVLTVSPLGVLADEPLVTAEWLSNHIQEPKLVLLHVGEEKTFEKSHIPGAQRIDGHADFSDHNSHSEGSLILELPPVSQLEATLEELGVSDDSTIVIYWSDDQITEATRALFTLDWAGLGDRTRLLDGGFDAWVAAKHEVTKLKVEPARGALTLSPRTELVVDADWLQEHTGADGFALVDGRSRAYFEGVSKSRGESGHIPGAGSTPWTELVDHDLRLKDKQSLRRSFAAAGVEPGDTVVAYCHIGQFATTVLVAARTLGHEVRLYDGSFQDWATRGLPVSAKD